MDELLTICEVTRMSGVSGWIPYLYDRGDSAKLCLDVGGSGGDCYA